MKKAFGKLKAGFTLIEMLVVIVIIIVLAGLVFRMARPAGDAALRAKCVAQIEILKALIEEYHSEFGIYPPVIEDDDGVQSISYEFPDVLSVDHERYSSSMVGQTFKFGLLSFFVARAGSIAEVEGNKDSDEKGAKERYEESVADAISKIYNAGYKSDWVAGGNNAIQLSGDPPRVRAFARRVRPYMEKLLPSGVVVSDALLYKGETDPNGPKYICGYVTCSDAWGKQFVYISKKPYTTYLLFSPGPDGAYDKNNPGDRSSAKNKDNIYGDIGHN